MRAPRDDDDFVLGNSYEPANLAASDTSLDLMTCALGQLSDADIAEMGHQDLLDLLSLSSGQPPVPHFGHIETPDLAGLQSVLKTERDRCRQELA